MTKNTTKKNLIWKFSKLPTPDEVMELVKNGIITKEEAKEILFATEEEKNQKDLKKEIQFLRELVGKMAENKSQIVETIKWIEKPYKGLDWFTPYMNWSYNPNYEITTCNSSDSNCVITTATDNTSLFSEI